MWEGYRAIHSSFQCVSHSARHVFDWKIIDDFDGSDTPISDGCTPLNHQWSRCVGLRRTLNSAA
eukprot:49188-Eustigmatos_ZCMA.PRE.1